VLHGRLANVWGGLGLAFGSVICWFSVLMSWYGVNYVLPAGKSLHGYGAGTGGFSSVLIYSMGELLFIGIAAYVIALRTPPKSPSQSPQPGSPLIEVQNTKVSAA
jgi:hypothetical protein